MARARAIDIEIRDNEGTPTVGKVDEMDVEKAICECQKLCETTAFRASLANIIWYNLPYNSTPDYVC